MMGAVSGAEAIFNGAFYSKVNVAFSLLCIEQCTQSSSELIKAQADDWLRLLRTGQVMHRVYPPVSLTVQEDHHSLSPGRRWLWPSLDLWNLRLDNNVLIIYLRWSRTL